MFLSDYLVELEMLCLAILFAAATAALRVTEDLAMFPVVAASWLASCLGVAPCRWAVVVYALLAQDSGEDAVYRLLFVGDDCYLSILAEDAFAAAVAIVDACLRTEASSAILMIRVLFLLSYFRPL